MNPKLKAKTKESLVAVLPITGIVLILSIFLVPLEVGTVVMFLGGAISLILGMGLFQLGAEMSMSPLGEGSRIEQQSRNDACNQRKMRYSQRSQRNNIVHPHRQRDWNRYLHITSSQ